MAKVLWKRLASVGALLSSWAVLNACTTEAGKPVECVAFPDSVRCQKIPESKRVRTVAEPAAPAKKKYQSRKVEAPSTTRSPTATNRVIPPRFRSDGYTLPGQ